jgi:hypothetical protein
MITDWIQTLAVIVATGVAIGGVIVATETLREQQLINRSQLALNENVRERAERRYAARIAWWADSKNGSLVYIQNRSPIPITAVQIVPRGLAGDLRNSTDSYQVDEIPPCRVATIRLRDRASAEATGNKPFPVAEFDLIFNDPHARWIRGRGDLQRGAAYAPLADAQHRPIDSWHAVEDCGEDG